MTSRSLLRAAACALAFNIFAAQAIADPADYAFEPVSVDVKNGPGSELSVRLVHKPSGKPVEGAVLFRTLLDMGPDDMAGMTAKHQAVPAAEPGVYQFKADLTMAGRWALRIMAKVPGEKETVEGTVVFNAVD